MSSVSYSEIDSDTRDDSTTYFDDETNTRCQLLPFFIEVCVWAVRNIS